jgi:hypothetical protein
MRGDPRRTSSTRPSSDAFLGSISSAPELADVDAIWYVRGQVGVPVRGRVDGDARRAVLRRHARIPGDDAVVRFLVIAPERTELVRFKLARSVLLRTAMDEGNWHVIKSNHLATFLAQDRWTSTSSSLPRPRSVDRAHRRADGPVRS